MNNLSVRLLILCLPVVVVVASLSPATGLSLTESKFPLNEAKQLIRDLNLFPKHSVNIAVNAAAVTNRSKIIVEKPFKFPNFADADGVSVEELGHHAGYYQIQHSHNAQYIPITLNTTTIITVIDYSYYRSLMISIILSSIDEISIFESLPSVSFSVIVVVVVRCYR